MVNFINPSLSAKMSHLSVTKGKVYYLCGHATFLAHFLFNNQCVIAAQQERIINKQNKKEDYEH